MKNAVYFLFLIPVYGELISPCPRLFKYDPSSSEHDRWYGTLTLESDSELSGIWIRLIFDKPSIQLGNWFGEVETTDNKEYLIKNRNHKLPANTPYHLQFFIQYDQKETPPQLVMFRLNAKTICPENGVTTEPPVTKGQLLTSSLLSTTADPLSGGILDQDTESSGKVTPTTQDESEFYPGDFNLYLPSSTHKPYRPPENDVKCGTVAKKATPLISHGQTTIQGQWPWHAALYHSKGAELNYICGGTLISEDHVLTAAHCVTKRQSKRPVDPAGLTIYLGKYNLKKFGPGTQDKEVAVIFVHPEYNYTNLFNDIAILKLKDSADLTDNVRVICLWEDGIEVEPLYNKLGTVVGWGIDENRQISENLMQAQMPIVSATTCIYSNREFFSQFTSEKSYCAGYRNGTAVCNGDSGGGMVFPKSSDKTAWQIRGVVSVGVAAQGQGVCDPTQYAVFTDVAKHLEWIRQVMKK